jgi:ribosomal protein S18 acetylase RimI-like enzyme
MIVREITPEDMADIFRVRIATRENAFTLEELARLGITESSVREMLTSTHRGWLGEEGGETVGFAMGDKSRGEMWVVAVLPSHEGRGIGKGVIRSVEEWLFGEGWDEIWLTTDVDTSLRAYGFYLHTGWQDSEIRDGLRYMVKRRPGISVSDRGDS